MSRCCNVGHVQILCCDYYDLLVSSCAYDFGTVSRSSSECSSSCTDLLLSPVSCCYFRSTIRVVADKLESARRSRRRITTKQPEDEYDMISLHSIVCMVVVLTNSRDSMWKGLNGAERNDNLDIKIYSNEHLIQNIMCRIYM